MLCTGIYCQREMCISVIVERHLKAIMNCSSIIALHMENNIIELELVFVFRIIYCNTLSMLI